jgi:hypothetical protein
VPGHRAGEKPPAPDQVRGRLFPDHALFETGEFRHRLSFIGGRVAPRRRERVDEDLPARVNLDHWPGAGGGGNAKM